MEHCQAKLSDIPVLTSNDIMSNKLKVFILKRKNNFLISLLILNQQSLIL